MESNNARMRALLWLLVTSICFVSGGATCSRRQPDLLLPPPPPVLGGNPALTDVVNSVNRTSVIRELSSSSSTVDVLSMPALPKLSATLAYRRDRDFRLRASLPIIMGTGLDMGSNQEVFWFEVPEQGGRTLYFARHDLYQQQLDRAVLPVDPTWISDALGLVQIDPNQVVAGPVMRPDGKLEVRSTMPLAAGVFQRVCYIDASAGHVTDQFLFAPSGARIAESHASNHQYYADVQCALPHSVQMTLTPNGGPPLQMQIDVGSYAVNQILSGDPNLFVMPQGAANTVDLTTVSPASTGTIIPTSFQQATKYQNDEIGPLPYRGLVR